MKTGADQHSQAMQRVRVGMIGLAAVILLIGLASAIFSSMNREQPVTAGAAAPGNVALASNAAVASEPLSELGAAPATDLNAAAPAAK